MAEAQGIEPALLDDIIRRLTEVQSARPGKQVQLYESEICVLLPKTSSLNSPICLNSKQPSKFVESKRLAQSHSILQNGDVKVKIEL